MKWLTRTGRTLSMQHLEQSLLYGGVLCGRFTPLENQLRVREWAEDAARRASWFDDMFIIPVAGRPVPARPDRGIPEGEWLPPVISFAVLRSNTPAKDEGEQYSSAAIVWCQAEFGLPDERTVDILRSMDWAAVSVDWSF